MKYISMNNEIRRRIKFEIKCGIKSVIILLSFSFDLYVHVCVKELTYLKLSFISELCETHRLHAALLTGFS